MNMQEMITIDGKQYRRFILYPGPIDDGTHRCALCGQIDKPEHHDPEVCTEIKDAQQRSQEIRND